MTLTYTGRVANAGVGVFPRLLLHWKGSIYRLIYQEMLIFCGLYAAISVLYRCVLSETNKRLFEQVVLYCEAFTNLIPLSFVLGFYVAVIVTRWWNQFLAIPWPDRFVMYMTAMIEGADEQGRIIRRTLVRYLTLSALMVFQATSICVKKRFPTMQHIFEAGIITEAEWKALDDVTTPHGKWWVPFVWATNLVKSARKSGRISDDFLMKTVIDEIMLYRNSLGILYCYDWISIPLVYTQVTTLAVYSFFAGCVIGRQFLDPQQGYPGHSVDLFVPVFTLLQFFFYMGWLKVAEQLINPFGEDDDDFELNWIIDRNMQLSMLVADEMHNSYPTLEKDMYFGENAPDCLPYTKSSISTFKEPFMGSTANLSVSDVGMEVVMETIPEGLTVSRLASPMPSPSRTHRLLHQNLLSATRLSQLSLSRSQLDMHKGSTTHLPLGLSDAVGKATSPCLDSILQQEWDGQRIRTGSLSHRFAPHVQSPLADQPPPPPPPPTAATTTAEPEPPVDDADHSDESSDSGGSDVPLIVVEKSSPSSSEECLSYEAPSANQSTVTSLTPLLDAVDCMPPAPAMDG